MTSGARRAIGLFILDYGSYPKILYKIAKNILHAELSLRALKGRGNPDNKVNSL